MQQKCRILIVDDNKDFCEIVNDYLSSQIDMEVIGVAHNGNEALKQIEVFEPDVVLLDIIMPTSDGLKVLKTIKNYQMVKNKPIVIVVSALSQETITQKAIDLGAHYYLIKPIDLEMLVDRIRTLRPVKLFAQNKPPQVVKKLTLEEEVTYLLNAMRISASISGFNFLREAIILQVETENINNYITKDIYPMVAQRFQTNAQSVERAIRTAIEGAWKRNANQIQEILFGSVAPSNSKRPSNAEFIAILVDRIRRSRNSQE